MSSAEEPFVLGDDVWYRLTVEFPDTITTRNPVVTDFLPQGVELREDDDGTVPFVYSDGNLVDDAVIDGNSVRWVLGSAAGENRFVPAGTVLEMYVPGTAVDLSASAAAQDMPQNLMKYQQENSEGDVFFLRDDASITLDHGMTLLKGVQSVDDETEREADSQGDADGAVFGSDRDGIEVVQGEVVTYRLDVATPSFATTDLVVWDVLPEGIGIDDVGPVFTATADGAAVTDVAATPLSHDDDGYPAVGDAYDGRDVIAWTVDADLPADTQLTLAYDVTVPAGALVTQPYDNTAGIVAYDAVTNQPGDATVRHVPDGPFERPVGDGEHEVPGTGTFDDSQVYLPSPVLEKTLEATEIPATDPAVTDAYNGDAQIVQGEHVTFDYSVTLPAHTTVEGGTLTDSGQFSYGTSSLDYEHVSAEVTYPEGVGGTDFTFDEETGELVFPSPYTTGDTDQTFTVTLTALVHDADASNPDRTPDLEHGTALTNTASFTHEPPTDGQATWTDTAEVTYIEPEVSVTKAADPATDVDIDTPVQYTVTVANTEGRPASYDTVVTDTVPEGLLIDEASLQDGGSWDPTSRTLTWPAFMLPGGETVTFTYSAVIDPATGGGQSYTNDVEVLGHTLPATLDGDDERRGDRADEDEATITAIDADITKAVRTAADFTDLTSVPVGETVEYQVEATLHPSINYWDAAIVDTVPQGIVIQDVTDGPTESSPSGTITDDWTYELSDSNVVTWTYAGDGGDITSHSEPRTVLVTYEALVTDDVATSGGLDNTAEFTWNRVNNDDDTREGVEDDATVTLLHPEVVIAKSVNNTDADTVEPGETFSYRLVVTNDGDTAGHNLVVTDTVPEGVVVDEASISSGGVLTGADAETGGGTITWDHAAPGAGELNGPLHPADSDGEPQSIALTYEATLAPSGTIGDDTFTNTTRVTEWESFADGGRSYGESPEADAVVTPAFPYLTLDKEPTGSDVAYAGVPFGWTLTATNTGDAPAHLVELTDTLPVNWNYTETTSVSVAGTVQDPEDYEFTTTGTGEGTDRQVLTWTVEGTPVLPPGATIQIAFLATPSAAALDEAGVGGDVAHTNTLAARATDPTGADGNDDGPYTDDPDQAEAFIHAADLALTKTAAEDGIVAGTPAATGWTITVSNNGPDTAVGPFTVTDTTGPLPEGVTVTAVSGDGWVTGPIERGEDGVTQFELQRVDLAETLDSGASFPEIEVTVEVAADVGPTEVDNTAVVESDGTHDPDTSNNEGDDELPITELADLVIEKSVNTDQPNAGESITWQLDPRNDGPSVSRSSAEQPISITDEVPAGIDGVTVETGGDWTAAIQGGGDFPAAAGDTITFTYTGDAMPVGAAGSITLTGTIDSSWPADEEIANTAVIDEGATEDPDPENNTSTVPTTPGTDTMLDIVKTRVVADGDGWQPATDAPVAGEPVSYLVTVANLGPADAQGVTVVDELPEYLTYASVADVEGTWERAGGGVSGAQDLTLTDPTALAPDATASFVITADLASGHTGEVENWAQAGADNATNEPEDEDSTSSTRDADLSIAKEHTGDAVAGGTLDYTLTVTNDGPSSSSGPITVADVLPAGFGYQTGTATVSVSDGPATQVEPEVEGQWLTWTVGDESFSLATDQTIAITLTTAIADDVPAQTGLVNTAIVDGPEDSDPSNNRDDDPTDVLTQADMTIVKTVEDGPWVAGTEVAYTFTVTNDGPSVADAVVTDVWPTGLSGVSISGDGWDCGDATCEFDGHPVGTSTLTVTALVDQAVEPGTDLENWAHLSWTDSQGTHEDEDPETIEVSTLADLGLVKTAVDENGEAITEATAGDQARFRLDVTNHGPSLAAAPITVTDTLPEGLTYVGLADATHWDATADGQEITVVLDDGATSLAAGAQAPELTLIVQVDAGLPVTDDDATPALLNVASVSSDTPEPEDDPNPNDDDEPLRVVHAADLEITKTHEGEATIGQDLAFDVVVTNHGPSTAEDVTVTETIPAGLDYAGIEGSDEAWTQVGDAARNDDGTTTVEYALDGTIAVNAQAPDLVITTTVTAAAYPEVTNVVAVDSPQPDPDPSNNEDPDPVPVLPDADLTITKETLTEAPHAGQAITWQLTPSNLGPAESASSAANPITITDTLPAGVSDIEVDAGSDWTAAADNGFPAQAGDTITLTYVGADAMPEGDTAPVTLTGTIDSSFTGEITNAAQIEPGPTPDRDPDNNTDEVTDPVGDTTALAVVKQTVDPATGEVTTDPVEVVPGTQVTYELTVSTTGTADAREVTLVDELPEGLTFASFAGVEPAAWTSDTEPGADVVELALAGSLPAPEGQATVRITADVADDLALDADDVTNLVTAGAENVPEDEWPTDEVTDPLDPSGDLSITKSHTGAVVAGLPVQYTLLVENHGPSVSPGPITVTDVLPAGLSYVSDSAQVTDPAGEAAAGEPAVDGQQLTWTIEDVVVPVEGTLAVTFQALVAPDLPATADPEVPALVNTGEVDGPVDDDPENNEDEDPTTITELTDVGIAKTVIGEGPFTAGTEVDYELTVTVAGPSVARDVVLRDVVPEGLSLVSIGQDGDGWAWDQDAGVGTRDTLALGEHVIPVTATIDQAVPAGQTLTNTGVVEWTDSDGPKRDDDPEDIGIDTDGDLAIVKTAVDADGTEIDAALAGTELRYTFEVTNHGPSQAVALLEITDELPDGLTFVEIVGDDGGWAAVRDGQHLTFTHPLPLAAGDTAPVLTIATQVSADVADGEDLANVAEVESVGTDEVPGTPDSTPENNEDDAVVTVERAVDLVVDKSHEGEARIGDELTFDLTVRNAGPSQASDVVVIDTLPAGLAYVGAAGDGWDVTAGEPGDDGTTTVTATLDSTLAPATDAPALQITVLVEAGAYPEVSNVAAVSSTEPDENPEDNTTTDPVPVPSQADLAVVKTAGVDRLQVGQTASYALTVTNHGPTEHVGAITVSDPLPEGLQATAVDGPGCEITEDGALVECATEETLAVDDTFTITVDVEVLASAWTAESAEAANTATVTGTSEDPDPENNTSTVTTPVDPDVRLELEKTRGEVDGEAVDWTIRVTSVGLNDAVDGVVVVDRLPAELRYDGVTSAADVECVTEGRTVECLVAGPIPAGESVDLTIHTTTSQEQETTITNVAWLVDPVTGEIVPDSEDSAEHRVSALPTTGVVVGSLAALALVLLLAGTALRLRGRTG